MRLLSEVASVLAVVVLYVIVVLSLFYPVLWIVFDWLSGMIVGGKGVDEVLRGGARSL